MASDNNVFMPHYSADINVHIHFAISRSVHPQQRLLRGAVVIHKHITGLGEKRRVIWVLRFFVLKPQPGNEVQHA